MKFSQVFLLLSVIFAISLAAPWNEEDELLARQDDAIQEKRFAITGAWVAKKLLGKALNYACNNGKLSGNYKAACNCVSLVAGDEESIETKRWFWGDLGSKIKGYYQKACGNYYVKLALGSACNCLKLVFN